MSGPNHRSLELLAGNEAEMSSSTAKYEQLEQHSKQLSIYQKTLLFAALGLPGFPGWSIVVFAIACYAGPMALSMYVLDPPGSGDIELDPKKSYATKMFIIATAANVCLTTFAMWVNVFKASANNSFSKNPEDWNTGDPKVAPKQADVDQDNARWARIHNNLLENVPITIALALCMLLCKPSVAAVKAFIMPYPAIRLFHMIWYSLAGSHEVRAMLFTGGIFCNCGCLSQIIVYLMELA